MLETLILVLGPGIVAAVLWCPTLLVGRFRSLFARLPPGRSTLASYLLVAVGLSIPFVIGTGISLTTASAEGAALSNSLLNLVVVLTITYVIVLPLVAGVGLPRIGLDWEPTNYALGTWLLLIGAVLWYAAIFAVPLMFAAFVFALPTG
jgi:hypothetical protein